MLKRGLYYFDDTNVNARIQIKIWDFAYVFEDSEVLLLWEYKMGHQNF